MIPLVIGVAAVVIVLALGYLVSFWLAGGLLAGALLIPGLILLLGDAVPFKQALGNINYTLGAITAGGTAIIYRDQGATIHPYDNENHSIYQQGEWHSLPKKGDWTTYRLGLRPLVIGYDADDALAPYAVPRDELPEEGEAPALLGETRGGYPLFTEFDQSTENLVVHVGKYIKEIGRAGTRLYNRTEEEALKKYGGDENMKQMYLMLVLFAAFGVMFVLTWIILGM